MTNHVRTLLLNRGRDGYAPDFPGEEYLVPKYRRRQLDGLVKRAWDWLFGLAPDRLFLNFRLRQLLTIVHASELAEFTATTDPRITYWPFNDATFADVFGIAMTVTHGDPTLPYVFGVPVCDESAGRCEQSWQIVATASDRLIIQKRTLPAGPTVDTTLTFLSSLSLPVSLHGGAISLRFRELTTDDAILVVARGQPQADIGEVMAGLAAMLGDDAASLFPDTAIGKTLLAVWTSHPTSMMRYAAIILALAYAVEQSPQEG